MILKFKESDFFRATAILIGAIVGAGIFGVPFVIAQTGFFIGVGYFVLLGAIVLILHLMYAEVIEHTKGKHRLIGYSRIYFGKKVKELVSVSVVISMYGSLIIYILLANNFFNTLFGSIFSYDFAWGILFWILLSIGVTKGLKTITRIESFMLGFLLLAMASIIFKGVPLIDTQNLFYFEPSNIMVPFGVVLFSLGGFAAIPEMRASIKSGSIVFRRSIITGVIFSAIITLGFAAVVVGISGQNTSEDAIGGLFPFLGREIIYLGALFGIFAIATSYLVTGVNLKESFMYDWNIKKWISNTLIVVVPVLVIAAGVKNFISVLGFTGAVLGAINGSVIALLFLKARRDGVRMPHLPVRFSKTLVFLMILVLIAGGIYVIIDLLAR